VNPRRFSAICLVLTLSACVGSPPTSVPHAPFASGPQAPLARGVAALKCRTLDDSRDATFNELDGINNRGRIVGHDGLGNSYVIAPPYGPAGYRTINYPGAAKTTAAALNDRDTIAGFDRERSITRGFTLTRGGWSSFKGPAKVLEFLGINDKDDVVGFYVDRHGVKRGFGPSGRVSPPGARDVVVSGINDAGDVTGFLTRHGRTLGFFLHGDDYTEFSAPRSTDTMAFGLNQHDEIVGEYADRHGTTHGFLLKQLTKMPQWRTFDEPDAVGHTSVNDINDRGDIVGDYVDKYGNTDGFVCT
jgi:uncharacterized membrane protein